MKLKWRCLLFVLLSIGFLWATSTPADQPVRENGTLPEDWDFELPEGVTTRDVTFYSDEVPCYGRLFFPALPRSSISTWRSSKSGPAIASSISVAAADNSRSRC